MEAITNKPKWELVEQMARQAGVKEYALAKWRLRGVPGSWAIKFIVASGGKLTAYDFISDS